MKGKILKVILSIDGRKGGYGFITSQELPYTRIFFHWTDLLNTTLNFADLKGKEEVEFELIKTEDKGYRAKKIKVLMENIV